MRVSQKWLTAIWKYGHKVTEWWETDPDTIKDAADELKQAQDDLNDKIKQDQIDQLQAEKDALEKSYQDRIDALQNFLDEQNYQIDKANREGIKSF